MDLCASTPIAQHLASGIGLADVKSGGLVLAVMQVIGPPPVQLSVESNSKLSAVCPLSAYVGACCLIPPTDVINRVLLLKGPPSLFQQHPAVEDFLYLSPGESKPMRGRFGTHCCAHMYLPSPSFGILHLSSAMRITEAC